MEIPKVFFEVQDVDVFIDDMQKHKWRFQGLFDYQSSRRLYNLYLRVIAHLDIEQSSPYNRIFTILKDTSKPYLVWEMYRELPRNFCHIIPYLFVDKDLIPTAFKILDKVSIDPKLLIEQNRNDLQWKESFSITNQIWLEMFDLFLDEVSKRVFYDNHSGIILGKILTYTSQKAFIIGNNVNGITSHKAYKLRYEEIWKRLGNKRFYQPNGNNIVPPRVLFYLLPDVVEFILAEKTKGRLPYLEFLHIEDSFLDLTIQILKGLNQAPYKNEINQDQLSKVKESKNILVNAITDHLKWYYTVEEIEVLDYGPERIIKKSAKRGVNEFGFEIIDWGYLYLHLYQENHAKDLDDTIKASLVFAENEDKYHDQNKEQAEKIRYYLKALLLAYLSINKNKSNYENEGLNPARSLKALQTLIVQYSLKYCRNDLKNKEIDIFDERLYYFSEDIYNHSLISLLYRAANSFDDVIKIDFINSFFDKIQDVGRLINAVNMFESIEIRNLVSKKIEEINLEHFIDSAFSITELEDALIETTNSERHWKLAEPLLLKIQAHFNKLDHFPENVKKFLFEVGLILALKNKDFNKLIGLKIPNTQPYHANNDIKTYENLKNYYIALFHIFNSGEYDKANDILESLLSNNPKNIRYAFNLYRSKTLKGFKE